MKLEEQIGFYEDYYEDAVEYPVEILKQRSRIDTLIKISNGQVSGDSLIVGCGLGKDFQIVSGSNKIAAMDLSLTALVKARREHQSSLYLQADGTKLPFDDDSFNVILCSEVIEHVPDADKLIEEFARILTLEGMLLLSTPNWIRLWGLARKAGEFILRRPVTSANQPIDNWFTYKRLQQTLQPHFSIEQHLGAWYFPPTGLGDQRLPDPIIAPVLQLLLPLDRFFGKFLPSLGHMHAVKATVR